MFGSLAPLAIQNNTPEDTLVMRSLCFFSHCPRLFFSSFPFSLSPPIQLSAHISLRLEEVGLGAIAADPLLLGHLLSSQISRLLAFKCRKFTQNFPALRLKVLKEHQAVREKKKKKGQKAPCDLFLTATRFILLSSIKHSHCLKNYSRFYKGWCWGLVWMRRLAIIMNTRTIKSMTRAAANVKLLFGLFCVWVGIQHSNPVYSPP